MDTAEYENPNVNDEEAIDIEQIQGTPADSIQKTGFPCLPPGLYVSGTRTINCIAKKTEKEGTPYLSVQITFSPFLSEAGDLIKQKPPKHTINTLPRKDGSFTSVADYLYSFGIDARLLAGASLVDALKSTEEQPVLVRTGIEEDWRARPEGQRARRDDFFKVGERYISEVQDPSTGRLVKGWPMVYGFRKYKS